MGDYHLSVIIYHKSGHNVREGTDWREAGPLNECGLMPLPMRKLLSLVIGVLIVLASFGAYEVGSNMETRVVTTSATETVTTSATTTSTTTLFLPPTNDTVPMSPENLTITNCLYTVQPNSTGFYATDQSTGNVVFAGSDAYTVIQSAINATSPTGSGSEEPGNGGAICLRDGRYNLNHAIMLWQSVSLSCESIEGTWLHLNYNGDIIQFRRRPGVSLGIGFNFVQNCYLDGNRNQFGNSGNNGIHIMNVSDVLIGHNFIDGAAGDCVRSDGRFYVRIIENWLESCGGNGVDLQGGVSDMGANCWVTSNVIWDNGHDGVLVASDSEYIYGNRVFGNGMNGVDLEGYGSDSLVESNAFRLNGQVAAGQYDNIRLDGVSGVNVFGNVFTDCPDIEYSLWMWNPVNTTITGNTFTCKGSGIMSGYVLLVGGGSEGLLIANNSGYNPVGLLLQPFLVSSQTVGLGQGGSASPTRAVTYTVNGVALYINSTSGAGVSITVRDNHGNVIFSDQSSLKMVYLQVGYTISFGSFSAAPEVEVYGA